MPLGDAALTVELEDLGDLDALDDRSGPRANRTRTRTRLADPRDAIDPRIHARVMTLAEAVRAAGWSGIVDIVPTFRSLTIHVDPLRLTISRLKRRLRRLSWEDAPCRLSGQTRHTIPVLYGGAWGPDLRELAAWANVSEDEVVRVHTSVEYRVYMLGFTPGFPYMGPVPAQLAMPRLATPRPIVAAGSVAIAGVQTGIYPVATPGGWRILGRTPLSLARPDADPPFRFQPGDLVTFTPIGSDEFDRLLCHPDTFTDDAYAP